MHALVHRKREDLFLAIFTIFPKLMPKDILIEFSGAKFIARKNKTDILLLNEVNEPWMKHYFKPSEGDIVIDIGAHVGKYSIPAAKLVGRSGKVIAIEPHPENFKALTTNILLNGLSNVFALNVAAFNEDGKRLRLAGILDDRYSLKSKEGEGVIVRTRTLDSILEELGISEAEYERLRWVKIDVEGAEVEVLEGMERIIKKCPNLNILIEIRDENLKDVDNILKGFKKKYIGGDSKLPVYIYWKGKNGGWERRRYEASHTL